VPSQARTELGALKHAKASAATEAAALRETLAAAEAATESLQAEVR